MSVAESIYKTLGDVMRDVRMVAKTDRVQGNMTRGIDSVLNAVGPALRQHGVIITPTVEASDHYMYTTKSGASMKNVTLTVRYEFHNEHGSGTHTTVVAEASDVSDKATAKAMSIALRTALVQVLALPTEDHTREYEQSIAATGKELLSGIIRAQRVSNAAYEKASEELFGKVYSWGELPDDLARQLANRLAG